MPPSRRPVQKREEDSDSEEDLVRRAPPSRISRQNVSPFRKREIEDEEPVYFRTVRETATSPPPRLSEQRTTPSRRNVPSPRQEITSKREGYSERKTPLFQQDEFSEEESSHNRPTSSPIRERARRISSSPLPSRRRISPNNRGISPSIHRRRNPSPNRERKQTSSPERTTSSPQRETLSSNRRFSPPTYRRNAGRTTSSPQRGNTSNNRGVLPPTYRRNAGRTTSSPQRETLSSNRGVSPPTYRRSLLPNRERTTSSPERENFPYLEENFPSDKEENFLPDEEEKKISSLEKIVGIIGTILAPFLTEEDKANLLSSTSVLDKYNFITLDLFDYKMKYTDFVIYFGKRPKANLIGLNLVFEETDADLSALTPFLPRLRRLFIHFQPRDFLNMNFLSQCVKLTELYLDLPVPDLIPLLSLVKLTIKDPIRILSHLIANYINLKYLHLISGTAIQVYLKEIKTLKQLETLIIDDNLYLNKIPSLVECTELRNVTFNNCQNLTNISGLENCTQITKLKLISCPELRNLNPLASCSGLEVVHLIRGNGAYIVFNTYLLLGAPKLRKLIIDNYEFDASSSFVSFYSLKNLSLSNIKGGLQIPYFPTIPNKNFEGKASGLEKFTLKNCLLTSLAGLLAVEELKEIEIMDCTQLTNVDFIFNCRKLINLKVANCPIENFDFLVDHPDLERVDLSQTPIRLLYYFNTNKKITHFNISGTRVSNLKSIEGCSLLKELNISNTGMNNIEFLIKFPLLEKFSLNYCTNLDNSRFSFLKNGKNIKELSMKGVKINNLKPLSDMKNLIKLDLSDCKSIYNLEPLIGCINLEELYLDNIVGLYNKFMPLVQLEKIKKLSFRGSEITPAYGISTKPLSIFLSLVPRSLKIIIGRTGKICTRKNGIFSYEEVAGVKVYFKN